VGAIGTLNDRQLKEMIIPFLKTSDQLSLAKNQNDE
jgi:hypothetical protein